MSDTPICTIDDTGIHRPEFNVVLSYLVAGMQSIFGDDIYLGNDSVDGQMISLVAKAVDDCNAQTVADYNAYSPATAQGAGLSSVVKTNNIQRKVPSYSTVPILVQGVAGTTIVDGVITDGVVGAAWALPAEFTIPFVGEVTVTGTAVAPGAISISPGAINTTDDVGSITYGATPGWQSAINLVASNLGAPVEQDSQLRGRQSQSTALPSKTTLQGLLGALLAIDGVSYARVYDNSTSTIDGNGVPGHCISVVVSGGDDGLVAQMITLKKGICGTYGTSVQLVTDVYGITRPVRYFRPQSIVVTVSVVLTVFDNFTLAYQQDIADAVASSINELPIGQNVYRSSIVQALGGVGAGYVVESVLLARDSAPVSGSDVYLKFYEESTCDASAVQFTLNPLTAS